MAKNSAPKHVELTPNLEVVSPNGEATADTAEANKPKVTVNGDKVTVTHRWRPDDSVKTRREHTATFDYAEVSREELIKGHAKAVGVPYVQGKLRTLVKVSATVDDKAFAEVNVKTEIVDAARGSKATLTPEQQIILALKNQGYAPEQVEVMIKAMNAAKSQALPQS